MSPLVEGTQEGFWEKAMPNLSPEGWGWEGWRW